MDRLRSAWKTVSQGTSRTFRWMTGRLRPEEKSASGSEPAELKAPASSAPESPGEGWGDRVANRLGHSRRTVGLAIGVGLIVVVWLGWTAYVWAENGMTAGIGVLISWPAVFAILLLVTAPFIGGAVAVRRHRAGTPVLAGIAGPATESHADETEDPSEGWRPKGETAEADTEESDDSEESEEAEEPDEAEESDESDEEDDDDSES